MMHHKGFFLSNKKYKKYRFIFVGGCVLLLSGYLLYQIVRLNNIIIELSQLKDDYKVYIFALKKAINEQSEQQMVKKKDKTFL